MPSTSDTISDLLQSISDQEDTDTRFLLASVINLYHEAIRRRGGRRALDEADIMGILSIVRILLTAGDIAPEASAFVPRGRPEKVQQEADESR